MEFQPCSSVKCCNMTPNEFGCTNRILLTRSVCALVLLKHGIHSAILVIKGSTISCSFFVLSLLALSGKPMKSCKFTFASSSSSSVYSHLFKKKNRNRKNRKQNKKGKNKGKLTYIN